MDRAVEVMEKALRLTPPGSPRRPEYAHDLAWTLHDRFKSGGDPEDLNRAIELFAEAIAAGSDESRTTYQNNLAIALQDRFELVGDAGDLDRAIDAYEASIKATSVESPDYPMRANNYATALVDRYKLVSHRDDLRQAIELVRDAVRRAPSTSSSRPGFLSNLGSHLLLLFGSIGDLAMLKQAIGVLDGELTGASKWSTEYRYLVHSLGIALSVSYDWTHDAAELERAIALLQEAVDLASGDALGRADCLRHLALALRDRFRATGDVADLNRAVPAMREAIKLLPADVAQRALFFDSLGLVLSARAEGIGWLAEFDESAEASCRADLEGAAKAFSDAVASVSPDSPMLPGMLTNLAKALRDRFEATGDWSSATRQRAVQAYQDACARGLATAPQSALRAAFQWASWAARRGSWAEAVCAYGFGEQALRSLVRLQLMRQDKETWLAFVRGFSTLGAYALARTGDLQRAAEAWESGRAVLLSEALDRDRANLDALRAHGYGELADRYERVVRRWSALTSEEDGASRHVPRIDALRAVQVELDQIVDAIRCLPGNEIFQAPTTFDGIRAAACDRPLVYLGATEVGGMALVVHPPGNTIQGTECAAEVVWLDDLTDDYLRTLADGWVRDYERYRAPKGGSYSEWTEAIDRVTRSLWGAVMGPVVDHLAARSYGDATVVATGQLGLLPLHAAWTPRGIGRSYVMDHVLLTYTPSARALRHARQLTGTAGGDSVLVVEEPMPTSEPPLRYAKVEAAGVASLFADAPMLRHDRATRAAVLLGLARAHIAHFACHGTSVSSDPMESGVGIAGDERLTVRDLFRLHLARARLATLSACETAIIGSDLPDEVVALPSSLLYAGFPGAIGSLWAVADMSTAMLMERFYRRWRIEGIEPRRALADAQAWIRNTTSSEKRDYFSKIWSDTSSGATTALPPDVLAQRDLVLAQLSGDPEAYEYAHPFHWAGFCFVGV